VEECFQAAAMPKERLGKALNKEKVLLLKLDRLQRVMERFPSTLWAKRAGLLSGVLPWRFNFSARHSETFLLWMTISDYGRGRRC
jgi:predicted GNAT superfamily acetyltransferase